jgi:hypothetical protein
MVVSEQSNAVRRVESGKLGGSSSEMLDVGLPRDGFVGLSYMSLEAAAFQQSLRLHVPLLPKGKHGLGPIIPDDWKLLRIASLPTSVQAEVCRLAQALRENARELTARYQVSHPRSLGDSPRFIAMAIFEDESTSSSFYNLPPLTRYNRCAEQGLVSDLVTKLSSGEKVAPIKSIILVGLASYDGHITFRIHPNFCSPCRTSLAELIPLGLITAETEIFSFAITMSQETPQVGRRTTFGKLVPAQVIEVSPDYKDRFVSATSCIEEICSFVMNYYPENLTSTEMKLLRRYLVKLIPEGLNAKSRSLLIARTTQDRRLILRALRDRHDGDLMSDGKVHYASAATVATLFRLALGPGIKDPIVIDILPLQRGGPGSAYLNPYSSVANQRRLDLFHDESLSGLRPTTFLQVFAREGHYHLRESHPVTEQSLTEGIVYRGRTSLQPNGTSEIPFSSRLVYPTTVAAQIVGAIDPDVHGDRAARRLAQKMRSAAERTFFVESDKGLSRQSCVPSIDKQGDQSNREGFSPDNGTESPLSGRFPQAIVTQSLEGKRGISELLRSLLEGSFRLTEGNSFQKTRPLQLVAAYAIGRTSEGKDVEVLCSPAPSLFTDSSHPGPLFNLCVELVTKGIMPKEIHVAKRSSFTLEGAGYLDLLRLLAAEREVELPLYLHNYRVIRNRDFPNTPRILYLQDLRRYSAQSVAFPLR